MDRPAQPSRQAPDSLTEVRNSQPMQNLISLNLPAQDLADIDNALATLRRCFAPMIALQPAQRRELYKMGDKSETFCRQTLAVLAANPQIVPPSLDLAEAQADLAALDQLRPRLMQLQQLVERADDTCLALGSDVITVALEGYGLLKVSGKSEALKGARKELSARFAKGGPERRLHRAWGRGTQPCSLSGRSDHQRDRRQPRSDRAFHRAQALRRARSAGSGR